MCGARSRGRRDAGGKARTQPKRSARDDFRDSRGAKQKKLIARELNRFPIEGGTFLINYSIIKHSRLGEPIWIIIIMYEYIMEE